MTATERPAGSGHPQYAETHPCAEETAAAARRLVRAALTAWDLDQLAESGQLVITELVANAVRHTSCPVVRLVVTRPAPDRVRLAVVDRTPTRLPALRTATPDATDGRGLLLVNAYADAWGYDLKFRRPGAPWGKAVWAELQTKDAE
ncbi:ATP-binding protein [Streptomyces sp. NBC_00201]|uniref:ATP-binding protein n=1 Tax=unclassified Streptomyces TaxID=2593676 RepID=UPI0022567BF3|nr:MULTISPECIES: ATP-binding protein [unclassified Streptomyces]MCX5250630.1 ATP-binding protein [Streptomyces sp. NBC_00201]MCX5291441.1 ATP-binding protein [Streptomyces sp. NBC_00183]